MLREQYPSPQPERHPQTGRDATHDDATYDAATHERNAHVDEESMAAGSSDSLAHPSDCQTGDDEHGPDPRDVFKHDRTPLRSTIVTAGYGHRTRTEEAAYD